VTKTVPAESVSRESLIHAAALAEGLSNHPIARSIQKAFGTPPQTESLHITEVPGQGLSMPLEKGMLLAGNPTLLKNNGITNFHEVEGSATVVHIAENGQYLGHIELSDIIRADAKRLSCGCARWV
jgi:Cation transport ATPase